LLTPSGGTSSWLIDLRRLLVVGETLNDLADLFWNAFERHLPFQVGGMEVAAIPLIAAIVLRGLDRGTPINGFIVRKERKPHGASQIIEGCLTDDPIVILDDVVNSAKSLEKVRAVLAEQHRDIDRAFCIIDFESPAGRRWAQRHGVPLSHLFVLSDFNLSLTAAPLPETAAAEFEIQWQFASPHPYPFHVVPKSAPLVDKERLYFGSDSGTMWCRNARDGSALWQFDTVERGRKGIFSAPRIHDSLLYFGAYDGNVYALDTDSGAERWRFTHADWVGSTPCLAPDLSLLFIGLEYQRPTQKGGLVALSLSSGDLVWEVPTRDYLHGSPAYDQTREIVVVGTNEGTVMGISAPTGTVLWRYDTTGPVKHAPAIDSGRGLVVAGSFDGKIHGINLLTGQPIFTVDTGNTIYSTPLVDGNRAFVGSTDKSLYVIDLDTGLVEKKLECGAKIHGSPERIGPYIYFGTNEGRVYEVDPDTLSVNGFCQFPDAVTNRVAHDDKTGQFFALTSTNKLFAFIRLTPPARSADSPRPIPITACDLARMAARLYLGERRILDADRYRVEDAGLHGGVFVSIRDKTTLLRLGRGGLWHFSTPKLSLEQDIVTATVRAIHKGVGITLEKLDNAWISVAIFGELRECSLGELDYRSHGIVVREEGRRGRRGGALPYSPEFSNEQGQYLHALKNARLTVADPHRLYLHTVRKHSDDGAKWPRFGSPCLEPWRDDPELGARLVAFVRGVIEEDKSARSWSVDDIPNLVGAAVTLFANGRAQETAFGVNPHIDAALIEAASTIKGKLSPERIRESQIAVSLLFDRTSIGEKPEQAVAKLRLGNDALALGLADREMMFLPFFMVHHCLDAKTATRALWQSAGQPQTATWGAVQCETWFEGRRLIHGFPARAKSLWDATIPRPMDTGVARTEEPAEAIPRQALVWCEKLAAYILQHATTVDAKRGRYVTTMDKFIPLADGEYRCLVALDALGHAGRMLGRRPWESHATFQLLTWLKAVATDDELRTKNRRAILRGLCALLSSMNDSNTVIWKRNVDWLSSLCEWAVLPQHSKTQPLEVLFGIKWAKMQDRHSDLRKWLSPTRVGLARLFQGDLSGLEYFAMAASELLQTHEEDIAPDLLGISDRILSWQNEKTGVFVPAMCPLGPTAEGALFLWITCLAYPLLDAHDDRRARYRSAWRKGFDALSILSVEDEDKFCLPNPDMALGAMRDCSASSIASLNAAGHMLRALTAMPRDALEAKT